MNLQCQAGSRWDPAVPGPQCGSTAHLHQPTAWQECGGDTQVCIYCTTVQRAGYTCTFYSASKPKLDLLKTCVAAIPRILPENMNHEYLTDLLSRLTIHLDHELSRWVVTSTPAEIHDVLCYCDRRAAVNSLHTMITNYPGWRHDIVRVFVMFLLRDVPDSCPLVLEATLKLLIQFIGHWRQMLTSPTSPDTEKHAIPVGPTYTVVYLRSNQVLSVCRLSPQKTLTREGMETLVHTAYHGWRPVGWSLCVAIGQ